MAVVDAKFWRFSQLLKNLLNDMHLVKWSQDVAFWKFADLQNQNLEILWNVQIKLNKEGTELK